jgi:hypothetical protein
LVFKWWAAADSLNGYDSAQEEGYVRRDIVTFLCIISTSDELSYLDPNSASITLIEHSHLLVVQMTFTILG